MKERQPSARTQNRKGGPKLARFRPFAQGEIGEAARKIKSSEQVVGWHRTDTLATLHAKR
jgi:hypothetical protein